MVAFRRIVGVFAALLLASCAGSGSPLAPSVSPNVAGTVGSLHNVAGSLHRCAERKPHCRRRLSGSSPSIYVPNGFLNGTVTAYPDSASGNVPPSATIAGLNTHLGPASAVAFDSAGNLYVRNSPGCLTSCIAVFAAGATGNVAPMRTICGPNTGLTMDQVGGGMAFDSAGDLYVANQPESVLEFAPGASGNVAPIATISGALTNLNIPMAIAIDATGKLYVSNLGGPGGSGLPGSITIFAAGASGNVAPLATIAGNMTGLDEPGGIALDANGNIFVANLFSSTGISEYAPTANGNVPPIGTIAGSNTQIFGPIGLVMGPDGTIYVTSVVGPSTNPEQALLAFAPGSMGNVAPTQEIAGKNTMLGGSGLIALH